MTKSRHIIRPKHRWTPEHDAMLMACYPHSTATALAKALDATHSAVYQRSHKLGVRKSEWFCASILASRLRRDDNPGVAWRFPKGNVPFNKGRKGVSYPGMQETQFKPGQMPHNTHPIGAYRITKDGTLQRKISNDKGSNSKRWRGVHELVWVEANGPIPPKHIVVFKPGTRTTELEAITLDKVECISLAENMRRNTYHRYGKEIAQLVQLKGAITRQINKREKAE
jgi:hypothetical protein